MKALIKNDYDTSYINDIYEAELTEDDKEDLIKQGINTSFLYLI